MKKQSNKYNTFIISLSLVGSMVLLGLGADVFSVSWRQLIKPVFVKEVKKEGVDFILVDDFEKGQSSGVFYERKNSIGGYQGTWAKRPSYSIITKLSDERDSARGRYLAIEYKKEAGWAGWYTLLNNADISNYNALTFWVKGDKGGEKFDIGLADAKMQEFQMDAVYAGPIDLFLPLGVTTEWQKVKIPVSRVESQIDLNKMGSIVLWFKYGGEGKVYIDDMEFESDKEVQKKEAFNSLKPILIPSIRVLCGYGRLIRLQIRKAARSFFNYVKMQPLQICTFISATLTRKKSLNTLRGLLIF